MFNQLIEGTKTGLLENINRSRAVIKLLSMKKGSQLAQEYIAGVKGQARLTRANRVCITEGELTRMALIGVIKCRLLATSRTQ